MTRALLYIFMAILCTTAAGAQTDTAASQTTLPPIDVGGGGIWEVSAGGGMTFPFEPDKFNDNYKSGYNFGGGIGYSMTPGEVGYGEVGAVAHYYNIPFDEAGYRTANNVPANAIIESAAADVLTVMAQFRGVFSPTKDHLAPYFKAGVGYFLIWQSQVSLNGNLLADEYKKSAFSWSVGAGVDVPVMEKIILFGEGDFILGVTGENGTKLFAVGAGVRVRI